MGTDTARTLTITIPLQLDYRATPNGRAHWGTKKRITDQMAEATGWAMIEAVNLTDPEACFWFARWPLTLDYEIRHGKGRKRFDDDNAIAAMKPVRDAIARCLGIDDRHIRTGRMEQTRDPDGKGCIVVTITESGEGDGQPQRD